MSYSTVLKIFARSVRDGVELDASAAEQLFGALLDGGVPELEMGAILMAIRMRGESDRELFGFLQAVEKRQYLLRWPVGGVRPVVIPSYYGTRHQLNLTPLLVLLLVKFGVPVLMHGSLEGQGRVATAYVLRELGVMPCANLAHANSALANDGLAFVPTALISPGLAHLLSLRHRLGVRNSAHTLVKLIAPFKGDALRIISMRTHEQLSSMLQFVQDAGLRALLLRGTEGEVFANSQRRPALWYSEHGATQLLFDAEIGADKSLSGLPSALDAAGTAKWVKDALIGKHAVPLPLINQIACCLYGSGYTHDMNQAKAIVAMEVGGLVAN